MSLICYFSGSKSLRFQPESCEIFTVNNRASEKCKHETYMQVNSIYSFNIVCDIFIWFFE